MQGKNLRKYYKIRDDKGERLVHEGDFPIRIGGGPTAGIDIPGLEENEEAAEIGLSEGGLHVRAAEKGVPVWHNQKRLQGSAWLKHGDTLQVGPCEIILRVEEEASLFQVLGPDAPPASIASMPETGPGPAVEITPLPFRVDQPRPRSSSALRWLAWVLLVGVFCLLSASAWFVFTARQVVVRIDPEPDRISMSGGLAAPRLGDHYLLRTGHYSLKAFKDCYRTLVQPIEVTEAKRQTINLSMEKLPGLLTLNVHQEGQPSVVIEGARVEIDGEEVGLSPIQGVEVRPGRRLVNVRAERYQDAQTDVVIEGCEEPQTLNLALVPGWADVTIRSVPMGAMVLVDGKEAGETPLKLEIFPGSRELEVRAEGFKTWKSRIEVVANQAQEVGPVRLLPADGTLALRTDPSGATVMVGGNYAGKTPLEIPLRPDVKHEVLISKPGYETLSRQVTLASDAVKTLSFGMVPKKGLIKFSVDPADSELLIDGKSMGTVPREMPLIAFEQQIEIRKEGYHAFRTKITPRPGFPQEIRIALKKLKPKVIGPPSMIQTADGYTLKLIRPGPFTMGASRREQGRRSNETLRKVVLTRPFYMGIREVTNKEFRRFLAEHDSGAFHSQSLNRDDLPVVEVTWEQAALFCNWLSKQESLPPVYVKQGDHLVAADPLGIGYRLPTEAEWEYAARFEAGNAFLKYPWGSRFPPKPNSGNFADISAKDLLANYLQDYNDGYPATAPPGKFTPSALGLYDMGGNVAEWCHDYYSIYPYSAGKQYLDPSGPGEGDHRVVRGSSWRQSSISALRLSYRDYSNNKRPDLGFRICRYLNEGPKEK